MQTLTPNQQRVFAYLRDTIARRQSPPTRAEIATALGFASANAAQAHLRTLARKGYIDLDSHRSRGIRIVARDDENEAGDAHGPGLPVVGRVAAGAPILAVEHIEQRCRVDGRLFSARPDYLLRVTGDSMINAGILDGDLLAVAAGGELRAEDIGVFRWDDEVTVKRFRREGAAVRLVAANPRYPDIVVDTAREMLHVEGRAVGVLRDL